MTHLPTITPRTVAVIAALVLTAGLLAACLDNAPAPDCDAAGIAPAALALPAKTTGGISGGSSGSRTRPRPAPAKPKTNTSKQPSTRTRPGVKSRGRLHGTTPHHSHHHGHHDIDLDCD